jgi:hypothetical protein
VKTPYSNELIGIAPALTVSNLPAPGDFLTLMAGRSGSQL